MSEKPITPLLNGFGTSHFPVTQFAPDGGPLTSAGSLDKGKTAIYELLRAAVNYECGDAWRVLINQEDTYLKWQAEDNRRDPAPIMDVITVMPSAQNLMQRKEVWPLLAVYREGEPTYENETIKIRVRKQQFSVDYIIGPLGADTQDRYGDFVLQVLNAMESAIENGRHPAYRNGVCPFQGVFSSVRIISSSGPACSEVTPEQKGGGYFGGALVLECVERSISQANAEIGTFERDAFYHDTTFPGYGDIATGSELVDNVDPPPPEDDE